MTVVYPEFLPDVADHPAAKKLPQSPFRRTMYRKVFKRALDVSLVLLSAPFVVPVVGALALAVRRDGGGAFYSQARIGKGGKPFHIWKLRTMVPDADKRLHEVLASDPAAKAEWDTTQKLRNDPRITPAGSFLRRSSLDELPQLWNVLRGDMSLIGPRPMLPEQRPMYPGLAYDKLRPGITGLWQTEGRNATTFAARAEYDARYEAGVTFMGDLRILMRTVSVVFRGTGC